MPRKLSPEEAAVLIIRRRLRQMEEDKMSDREPGEKDLEPEDKAPKRPGRSNNADKD